MTTIRHPRSCHCDQCTHDRRIAKKRRELNRHLGIPNRLDPAPARQHLTLLRQTMGWIHISQASGCSACYLRHIAAGRVPTINRTTHDKILSVKPAPQRDGGFYINATPSVRRVRALMAIGHAQHTIATAAETTQHRICRLTQGQTSMRQKLADKIQLAYGQLAHTPGTSARAQSIAAAGHWPDPTWWDDMGGIDDPTAPESETAAQPTRDELAQVIAEDIQYLASFGTSEDEIARRVGRSESYVREQLAGRRGPGWRNNLQEAA